MFDKIVRKTRKKSRLSTYKEKIKMKKVITAQVGLKPKEKKKGGNISNEKRGCVCACVCALYLLFQELLCVFSV